MPRWTSLCTLGIAVPFMKRQADGGDFDKNRIDWLRCIEVDIVRCCPAGKISKVLAKVTAWRGLPPEQFSWNAIGSSANSEVWLGLHASGIPRKWTRKSKGLRSKNSTCDWSGSWKGVHHANLDKPIWQVALKPLKRHASNSQRVKGLQQKPMIDPIKSFGSI